MLKFVDHVDCVGCTACASICPVDCINMMHDNNGFIYPVMLDEGQCIECNYCQQVCPAINNTRIIPKPTRQSSTDDSITKNKDVVAYAAYSCDTSVRTQSSSGGVFSEIAKYVFLQGGVVYGAAYDEYFRVYHCCIKDEIELSKIRGAKYAESNLKGVFEDIAKRLNMRQMVLFSGTSCQVAGLKSFIENKFSTQQSEEQDSILGKKRTIKNLLICVDFVCHGIPSPMVWQAYIDYQAQKDNKGIRPLYVNLRDKTSGWSHYQYSTVFQYPDTHISATKSTENPFMKLYIGDYISRSSCSHCFFKGYKRVSDITIGDFWGIWDIMPEMDDNKGTSVVLIQTSAGMQIWNMINQNLCYHEVSLEEASRHNPSMIKSSLNQEKRDTILNTIREKGFIVGFNKTRYFRKSFFAHLKNILQRM